MMGATKAMMGATKAMMGATKAMMGATKAMMVFAVRRWMKIAFGIRLLVVWVVSHAGCQAFAGMQSSPEFSNLVIVSREGHRQDAYSVLWLQRATGNVVVHLQRWRDKGRTANQTEESRRFELEEKVGSMELAEAQTLWVELAEYGVGLLAADGFPGGAAAVSEEPARPLYSIPPVLFVLGESVNRVVCSDCTYAEYPQLNVRGMVAKISASRSVVETRELPSVSVVDLVPVARELRSLLPDALAAQLPTNAREIASSFGGVLEEIVDPGSGRDGAGSDVDPNSGKFPVLEPPR